MPVAKRPIAYEHNGVTLEGMLAYDDASSAPRPTVLVSHAWAGRSDFEIAKAEHLASLGYVGFALDLYGKGVLGGSNEENQALMQPFLDDRAMLQDRLKTALAVVKEQPESDAAKTAATGYCFGGLCVLDMARSGADVLGVASFHGLFTPPENTKGAKIDARVIAFHGYDDPMAPPEAMTGLAEELTKAGADWQIHAYGGTMHAFTNPAANSPDAGMAYNEKADARSASVLADFLEECFV